MALPMIDRFGYVTPATEKSSPHRYNTPLGVGRCPSKILVYFVIFSGQLLTVSCLIYLVRERLVLSFIAVYLRRLHMEPKHLHYIQYPSVDKNSVKHGVLHGQTCSTVRALRLDVLHGTCCTAKRAKRHVTDGTCQTVSESFL